MPLYWQVATVLAKHFAYLGSAAVAFFVIRQTTSSGQFLQPCVKNQSTPCTMPLLTAAGCMVHYVAGTAFQCTDCMPVGLLCMMVSNCAACCHRYHGAGFDNLVGDCCRSNAGRLVSGQRNNSQSQLLVGSAGRCNSFSACAPVLHAVNVHAVPVRMCLASGTTSYQRPYEQLQQRPN